MKRALLFIATTLFGITLQAQTLPDSIQVSTFAGTGVAGSTNGPAASASFNRPNGICIDAAGNLYIADENNYVIRKITPAGVVSTFAGSGSYGYADGTGTNAGLDLICAICCDTAGNVYAVGRYSGRIRKITPGGVVSTLTRVSSNFDEYVGICADKAGTLYIPGLISSLIYKVTASGQVSVFAGSTKGYNDGTGTNAQFNSPEGICIDDSNNLFVAEGSFGNQRIRKITPAAVVSTVAGSGAVASKDGNGTSASFSMPNGLCVDASGNLYVTDEFSNEIRKIKPNGDVITIAGDGNKGCKDDIGKNAEFYFNLDCGSNCWHECSIGIIINKSGTLFVCDQWNNKIREIQQITPKPPVINYPGLNAHVCMGSSVNYQPAATGSSAGITLQVDSFYTGHQKGICKTHNSVYVLCAGDSIRRYDFSGNYKQTYNTLGYQNVTAIAADDSGRLYLAAPDNTNSLLSNIYRLNKDGSNDLTFPNLPSGYILKVSALRLGPDGKLYIADTNTTGVTSGYITTEDTNTATPTRFSTATPNNSFNIVTGLAFGKNNQLFVTDIGYNNIFVRNAANDSYYKYFSRLDTLKWKYNSIDIDTTGIGVTYISTKTSAIALSRSIGVNGDTTTQTYDYKQLGVKLHTPSGLVTVPGVSFPMQWIADTNSNYVKRVALYAYQISPALPQGLTYDFLSGKITGTPTVATATQTYTITVTSPYGTNTSTFTFSVDPQGPLSNSTGTIGSRVVNQTAGLTVNYNDTNSCSKLMTIADSVAGKSAGFTQVNQTVYPTIATFGTGQFVPRVNQVNAQNPNSPAGLTMYFTYQDIANFNASNTSGQHLSNDTTTGTMQVAVLQLHKDSNGNIRPIPHSPITAKWISKDKDWEVDFRVSKFSTFYMGTPAVIGSFTCANSHADTIVTSNSYYLWHNDTIKASGTYADTLTNVTGCDSVCTLKLTLSPTGISTPLLNNSTKIYPNPSTGVVFVDINDPNVDVSNLKITVTSILGEVVYNATGNSRNIKLDLSRLQKGCYILNISSKQESINKRIVLEQ